MTSDVQAPAVTAVVEDGPARRGPLSLVYLAFVLVPIAVAVLLLTRHTGGAASTGLINTKAGPDPVAKLLISLPVILIACRLCASLFKRLSQPQVVGEIVAGLLLGPSALGLLWPAGEHYLFPAYLSPALNLLAQIGLVLFMFLVGYDMDLALVRRRARASVTVSQVSIALPFASGIVLAAAMYSTQAKAGVSFVDFALFFAVSMSITAFPVLARVLVERRMDRTPLGSMALTCAAVNDIVAWCLLAVVVAAGSHSSLGGLAITLALLGGFFVVMVTVVRPALAWLMRADAAGKLVIPVQVVLPVLVSAVFLAALATSSMGVHPIFGAFLLGAITPRDAVKITGSIEPIRKFTVTMLLPLFFVYTGLQTRVGLLGTNATLWGWCGLIIVVAVLGKAVGSTLAARTSGVSWQESFSLGTLMNCRGLTELIVLNVGLSLGVISQTVFTMLVVMTLVSTVMTVPVLRLIERIGNRRTVPAN